MLYSQKQRHSSNEQEPTLVFIHGLLGTGLDWQACSVHLTQFPFISIDLPGHGNSAGISCLNSDHCCKMITSTLLAQLDPESPLILIGYSLGARIIMQGLANSLFSGLNIKGALIEGGNFGLECELGKSARLANDEAWAKRFRYEPIAQVLADWYQQPVFSSLKDEQRQALISKRSANLGPSVADMLEATSLAKQDYLLDRLKLCGVPLHYICGEYDRKFSQMAVESSLSFTQIKQAGHNVHQEQPLAFAQATLEQIQLFAQKENSTHR
ncbi:2-succinyl-6-hydroxy-2,4-cyclohexadiene-1-carboxylate synthase [Vibrio paucivorans]|uniref:Putative 2-succinyl-6-hydroxy-2,4-cyclohexadiene-1-carboxylate synthase n=1 Tax=Vibrio paucivorans TaxID=2829489 RepID=A0A9X3CH67_9VIBR|nr:2-succinyl-6-hydroxy-2,4-cyclohexadiene-1-carboxylate synthase [Vibrio paucivorans]MCW8334655.1 2-succinyl-6-hydroxy-2,4-cyclohexadiene-1-carboxylate synthase [Vibrio paucivorans]